MKICAAFSSAVILASSPLIANAGITKLVALNGGPSCEPRVISADGSIVAGQSYSGAVQFGTVWSGINYTTPLGVGFTNRQSLVTGMSADGQVRCGFAQSVVDNRRHAFVKSSTTALQIIDGTTDTLGDYRISADGTTIVGPYTPVDTTRRFARWRESTGWQLLTGMETRIGNPFDVSDDGSAVTGEFQNASGVYESFVWREGMGPTTLPKLMPAFVRSSAGCMSANTMIIVGSCATSNSQDIAVKWTYNGSAWSVQSLGAQPAGVAFSFASHLSADGSVITGAHSGTNGLEAFVWTQATGKVTLNQYASLFDVDLSGWTFQRIYDVTPDGSAFCATGIHSTGVFGVVVKLDHPKCGTSDFDGDGDYGTDADIMSFFACLGGDCCPSCFAGGSDFNDDGDYGTDADIESFFRVLAGGPC